LAETPLSLAAADPPAPETPPALLAPAPPPLAPPVPVAPLEPPSAPAEPTDPPLPLPALAPLPPAPLVPLLPPLPLNKQAPLTHVPPVQGVESVFADPEAHCPLVPLQVPGSWHSSIGAHVFRVAVQSLLLQWSPSVQGSPSLHSAASFAV